jgi:hypothetical protein
LPFNPAGVYTLPNGYAGVDGQPILTSQHNPPLEDIQSALSLTLLRDGRAPMTANLNMNTFKMIGLGTATAGTDAVNKTQMDTADALKVSKAGDTMTGTLGLVTATTTNTYQMDNTTAVALNNLQVILFTNGSGMILINDHNNGNVGMFLAGGGGTIMLGQSGTTFSTTPNDVGKVSVWYDIPNTRYVVQNSRGGAIGLSVTFIRTRTSV